MNHMPTPPPPLLRSLVPSLRALEGQLRAALSVDRRYKFDFLRRSALEGIANDLQRQAAALDVDRPLLVVMLMGGTGVGKSTLFNALAGSSIAQASFQRPTTRDPVVYFHQSVRPERLAAELRQCRLASHDRADLEQKVFVDTPDLDSNDLANRDKLKALLPVADVVLYVGSQEKYHDQLGWELFREQRKRRAFAFVLNKWDRCLHPGASGLRPDEDLLLDLKKEGFEDPRLFRTSAQRWLDRTNGQPPKDLPEGEQFADLQDWLERGLTRLEIEAVKARGVSQMLEHMQDELTQAAPPDLKEPAERTRRAWERVLDDEAAADTEVLLATLDPHQSEIELHFSLEGQNRFWGLMRGYLKLFTGAKQMGSTLRERIPFLPRTGESRPEPLPTWDFRELTRDCCRAAGERSLDQRGSALANRLLVLAGEEGFPVPLLSGPTESATRLDWRQRFNTALNESLNAAQQVWSKPTGTRRWLQLGLVSAANWLPNVALISALVLLMWRYFVLEGYQWKWVDVAMPFLVTLIVLVLMQVLINVLLPMRWAAIRAEFRRQLEQRLRATLADAYLIVPGEVATALDRERQQIEELRNNVAQVAENLNRRQQEANISGLYGN